MAKPIIHNNVSNSPLRYFLSIGGLLTITRSCETGKYGNLLLVTSFEPDIKALDEEGTIVIGRASLTEEFNQLREKFPGAHIVNYPPQEEHFPLDDSILWGEFWQPEGLELTADQQTTASELLSMLRSSPTDHERF